MRLPLGKCLIGTKWVFKIKVDGRNIFEYYKSMIVTLRYLQEFEIDFDETFESVVRIDIIRYLFAIAIYYVLEIILVDCKSAILHGDSDFELYVGQPLEFIYSQYPNRC